jgi:L-ascorbate metabolism protein UlaG (beta-lactamase superfamily)
MPHHPKSDHFNGTHFFNPTNPKGHGLGEALKMIFTTRFKKWPKNLKNNPAPDLHRTLNKNEVAVTFVNHATVLVQASGFNFLTDPVWSKRVSPVTWAGPKRYREAGVRIEELPPIDFVVISHNHYDHMDLATLKKLNEKFHPKFFVPIGNKTFLENNGIGNVAELDWWQTMDLVNPNVKVSLAPAEHFSSRSPFDRNKTLWGSFIISSNEHSFFFAGDTAYSPHFKEIHERFGPSDIAFLPIGAYDPRWFMKAVHMNPEEAVQAHEDLVARKSIGVHFGTFQLTSEAFDQPVKDLNIAMKKKNISNQEFQIIPEGQTQIFDLGK